MPADETKPKAHDSKTISPEPESPSQDASPERPDFIYPHGDPVAIALLDFTRIDPNDGAPYIDPSKIVPVTVEHEYMLISSPAGKNGPFRPDVVSRPQTIFLRNPDKSRLMALCFRQHKQVACQMGLPEGYVWRMMHMVDPDGDQLGFNSGWWNGAIRTALMVGVELSGGSRAKIVVRSRVMTG